MGSLLQFFLVTFLHCSDKMLDKNSEKKTFIVAHGFKGLTPSSPVLGQSIMVAGASSGRSCHFMVDRNQRL